MADTLTTNLSLTKPEPGASADSWGGKLNDNFDDLDALFDAGPALKVSKGGTGATTASAARDNLGLGDAAVEDIVPVAKGGTGGSTASTARTNLGLGGLAVMNVGDLGDLAVKDQVAQSDLASGVGNPAGMIAHFALSSAPAGWLKANGDAVSRSTYSALFAAIGTTFGSGNGSTTFNLPDLRGEFVRGLDDARGVDSGRALGSAQLDQFQAAREAYKQSSTVNTNATESHATGGGGVAYGSTSAPLPSSGAIYAEVSGYGTPRYGAETRPRNVALLACIKY